MPPLSRPSTTPTALQSAVSTGLLDSLVLNFPGVLYRCALDENWTMHFISPGIEALVGYPASDFLDNRVRSYASLIHPDDVVKVDQAVRMALTEQHPFDIEYRLLHAGGDVRWVHERGRAVPDPGGSFVWLDGVIVDTTETHRLGAQLAAIVAHTPNVAIETYTASGRVLSWNPAAERLFGWRAEQVLGRTLDEFLLSPEDFRGFVEGLASIAASGTATTPAEWVCQRPDGGQAHCLATQFEIPTLHGHERTFVCMDVDIGELHTAREALTRSHAELESRVEARSLELKQAMAQLMESQKLAALGRLVAGVAHELNTPIGNARTVSNTLTEVVTGFDRRLQDKAPIKRSELLHFVRECRIAAELIERATLRAAEQIGHFKQVAVDQQSNQRRRFELRATLSDIAAALAPQFRRTPHVLRLGAIPEVLLDSYPGPLEQVLVNLVENARVHGLEARATGGRVQVDAELQGDQLSVFVRDDGVGIPAASRSRVFEPFFSTRLGQGGSGLGLHIAHNLTTGLLGGSLTLMPSQDAEPGTCFRLSIPLQAPR